MLRVLALSFALLLPATLTAGALPIEPSGSFAVDTPSYSATLTWVGGASYSSRQAAISLDAGGRSGSITFGFEHVSDVILREDSGLRPTLSSATIVPSAPPTVTLVYDFAATGALPETSTVLKIAFLDDSIVYETTSRAPNAAYVSYVRARTSLDWTAPWNEHGAILPGGVILSGDDGRALDPLQEWEVVATYGVYQSDVASSLAQARLRQGDQVNYLDEGSWRVGFTSVETSTVFNTFLDAPTGGLVQPLWTRDALVFAATPAVAASRIADLAQEQEIPSRASQDEQVVIALADTGINPYHIAFRDTSPLGYAHPSTYIAGYPVDVEALDLTLNATDLASALEADAAVWASVVPDQLYWIPGTKIVGVIASGVAPENETQLTFSTGHGTMTASRAAANEYSLCPECRVVMMQAGNLLIDDGARYIRWAAEQEWIDVQSHSWSGYVPFQNDVEVPGVRDAIEFAAGQMPVFVSGGNGASGKLGVLGHPAFTRPMGGAKGAIPVGGHDNGFVTAWTSQYPYVSADACSSWAAVGTTVDTFDPEEGGGTSASTPYTAGEAGRIILEARRVLGSPGDRSIGILAAGPQRPDLEPSPLADGEFTLDELKSVLFRTATARPAFTRDDGALCGSALHTPSNTLPVAWMDYPSDVSAYPFIGWGGIDVTSRDRALDVLHGAPMPVRPIDEEAHAQAETLRAAWYATDEARDVPNPMGAQDDAGTGGDAPELFVDTARVQGGISYEGQVTGQLGDQIDIYSIALRAGDLVHVQVRGVQACLSFHGPSGSTANACHSAYATDAATGSPGIRAGAPTDGVYFVRFVSAYVPQHYAFGIGVNENAPSLTLPSQI